MDIRRTTGNALIVFGILNLLNFYAPRPIPTVGVSAFLFGGLLIGAGIFLKRNNPPSTDGSEGDRKKFFPGLKRERSERKTKGDPLLAVRALRLASENGGRLTVAQTAMELNVPLDAAEAALDECAARGSAYIDVDPANGIASYRFPEFLSPKQ